jgi:ATP-dependent DNA helicase RecQ
MPQQAVGLFEALRVWRAAQAREQGVPAYVVFNDATLRGIAAVRPADVDQLAEISGVGAAKLERYGRAVLDVVASEAD